MHYQVDSINIRASYRSGAHGSAQLLGLRKHDESAGEQAHARSEA